MRFGKTEALSDKPAAPCTEGQMSAFNTLGIPFPSHDSAFSNMCLVSIVCVSVYDVDVKGRKETKQFVRIFMPTCAKTKSKGFPCIMVDGSP